MIIFSIGTLFLSRMATSGVLLSHYNYLLPAAGRLQIEVGESFESIASHKRKVCYLLLASSFGWPSSSCCAMQVSQSQIAILGSRGAGSMQSVDMGVSDFLASVFLCVCAGDVFRIFSLTMHCHEAEHLVVLGLDSHLFYCPHARLL